jgi:hypothetical protein
MCVCVLRVDKSVTNFFIATFEAIAAAAAQVTSTHLKFKYEWL